MFRAGRGDLMKKGHVGVNAGVCGCCPSAPPEHLFSRDARQPYCRIFRLRRDVGSILPILRVGIGTTLFWEPPPKTPHTAYIPASQLFPWLLTGA